MKTLTSRFCPSYLGNKKGSLLVWIALLLIIISAAIGATIWIVGSKSRSGKISSTVGSIDAAVNAVISYGTANKVLPDNVTFPTILSNPKDPWGNNFIYRYDNNLTTEAGGGICGRTTTSIQDNGVYIAFLILSKGPDFSVATAPGTSGPETYSGILLNYLQNPTTVNSDNDNIYKAVTLEELKNKAGCYGTTGGRLTIMNTQLPSACSGTSSYSAIVYASGGVPTYNWTVTNAPAWLRCNGAACGTHSNTSSITLSAASTIPTTPASNPITFIVTDSTSNTFQKTLVVTLSSSTSCGVPPGSEVSFANNISQFKATKAAAQPYTVQVDTTNNTVALGGNVLSQYGCFWFPDDYRLKGNTMRSYFEAKFDNDIKFDNTSGTNGYGITFAIINSNDNTTVCGANAASMGYGGGTSPISGKSLAVEFDTSPTDNTIGIAGNGQRDPKYNHVAILEDGSVTHPRADTAARYLSADNRSCTWSSGAGRNTAGCYGYMPAGNDGLTYHWLEDGNLHKIRTEIKTNCIPRTVATVGYNDNSTCLSCGNNDNASATYAEVSAWIDCNDSRCYNLTANYTADNATISHCFVLDPTLDNVKFGFTEGTGSPLTQNVTISSLGVSFYEPTTPTCTLTADFDGIIDNGTTSRLVWSVANGPADVSFIAPVGGSGGCLATVTSGSGGGNCTTANLFNNTIFKMYDNNSNGNSICSKKVCIKRTANPQTYRVWNNDVLNDFLLPDGTCRNIANNAEITTTPNACPSAKRLCTGGTIYRYASGSGCTGASTGQFTFDTAVCADNDGDGQVYWSGADR